MYKETLDRNIINDTLVFDIETYPNATCFGFKSVKTGQILILSVYGEDEKLSEDDMLVLRTILANNRIVTFNGAKFDMPLTVAYLHYKYSCAEMFTAVERCISLGFPSSAYKVCKALKIPKVPAGIDHWDLMAIMPGDGGLKMYGARLNAPKLQDLPYEPNTVLTRDEWDFVIDYNENDLDLTIICWEWAVETGEFDNRLNVIVNEELGTDLAALVKVKDSVQIAELVLVNELRKANVGTGKKNFTRGVLKLPEYMNEDLFQHPELKRLYRFFTNYEYPMEKKKLLPLPKLEFAIAGTIYNCGLGGLHSVDDKLIVISDDKYELRTSDVASYYPANIINNNAFRSDQNEILHPIYKGYRDTRVKIKKSDKPLSAILKLFLNGSFGKLGEQFSLLYNPSGMLRTTITGQLALLLLIERLEIGGFSVFSANTDGVEYYCERSRVDEALAIVAEWEKLTNLVMENSGYVATFNRDVNDYIAIYADKVKSVGVFAPHTTPKKRQLYPIVFSAIRKMLEGNVNNGNLLKGVDPFKIIDECDDIREFLVVVNVTGGAYWTKEPDLKLGKVVRFYYGTDKECYLARSKNGNRVASSMRAVPIMDLPKDNKCPVDLDRTYYKLLVQKHLDELGIFDYDPAKIPRQISTRIEFEL